MKRFLNIVGNVLAINFLAVLGLMIMGWWLLLPPFIGIPMAWGAIIYSPVVVVAFIFFAVERLCWSRYHPGRLP